jgi:hypothetical protein
MEPDGVTRLYIKYPKHEVWPVYPEEKIPYRSRLKGLKAKKVLRRVDFKAINEECPKEKLNAWAVIPNRPYSKYIKLNRKRWKYRRGQKYSVYNARLVRVLEKRSGKKGFTILIIG